MATKHTKKAIREEMADVNAQMRWLRQAVAEGNWADAHTAAQQLAASAAGLEYTMEQQFIAAHEAEVAGA
jgi:hypothetical protein